MVVTANAVMGSVQVLVPRSMPVRVEGIGIMGDFSENGTPDEIDPSLPLLRVRGVAFWGSVDVRRKGPPGGRTPRLRGR